MRKRGEVDKKELESMLENLDMAYEETKKILKEGNGGIFWLVALPNITPDEYEKYEFDIEGIKGVNASSGACNSATLAVFDNVLDDMKMRIRKECPELFLEKLASHFKSKLIINEEDLKDES